MTKSDPTLPESLLAGLAGVRTKAEPYLTWLPDWIEPHAVDVVAVLITIAAALAIWKKRSGNMEVDDLAPQTPLAKDNRVRAATE